MIPLGREETQTLEFKGRELLRKPAGIARAAVAMLNARGGEIWIGLGEANSRAIHVEPIEAPERERQRLWNHLVDSIEPSPTVEELELEEIATEEGRILRLRVVPQDDRRPYAQLKEGGRFFVIRTGARVRPMTREEIMRKPSSAEDTGGDALAVLRREREELLEVGEPMFWLRIQPTADLSIDVRAERVERLLRDPLASGNRPTGWGFADPHSPSRVVRGQRILGEGTKGRTVIEGTGAIDHRVPLSWLTHSIDRTHELYPLALIEKIASIFRLASVLYSDLPSAADSRRTHVLVDHALTSARGWRLPAYSPHSAAWLMRHHEKRPHLLGALEEDFLLMKPVDIRLDELLERPDACALQLVRLVYEAFGLEDTNMIPSEFDQRTGVLRLPS